MILDLYYLVSSFFDSIGVYDFLFVVFPQAEQLASLDTVTFFYTSLSIVVIVWLVYVIVSLAIRLVSYILGVIIRD